MKFINYVLNIFKKKEDVQPWYDLYDNGEVPSIDYPKWSIYEEFNQTAKKYPLYIAYNYFGKKVTYMRFNLQIQTCAKALKKIGVKKKDVITICMPNSPEAIIMFYAINAIGAIANMIHPLSSEKEIEYYLNKSNSKYILTLDLVYDKVIKVVKETNIKKIIVSKVSDSMRPLLKIMYKLTSKPPKINYDDFTINYKRFFYLGNLYNESYLEKGKANDDAVILYSGGTTGNVKGAVLTNLNFNALGMQSFKMTDPAKAGDSVLVIMPIFHGFGIGVSVHTCLISGMTCLLIPQFRAREFHKLIKKYKPNFLAGVPTMYEALINSKQTSRDYLKCVTTVICGGDILNETLQQQVNKYLKDHGSKAKIRVGYGLTECTGASCLTPRHYFKEGGIGIPFPDTLYQICQIDTENKAQLNEVGEICISGPTVMKRYLKDPKETKKTLKLHEDGKIWLHTGDLGFMNEQGLVFFASRLKRMIVSSGYNIYPQMLEKILLLHPAVLSCYVIGIDHPYKKQVPKAFIVLKEDFEETDEIKEDIKKHCEKNIAKYAIPYEFEYVKELPKTKVGKVAFTKLQGTSKNGKK